MMSGSLGGSRADRSPMDGSLSQEGQQREEQQEQQQQQQQQHQQRVRRHAAGSLSTAGAVFAGILAISGNSLSIIAINFWLKAFPRDTLAELAILVASNIIYFSFFLVVLAGFTVFYGPKMIKRAFCGHSGRAKADAAALRELWAHSAGVRDPNALLLTLRQRWQLFRKRHATLIWRLSTLVFVGFLDIFESLLNVYATPSTPEVLQALLQCTIPFFALLLSVAVVPGEREKNFRSPLLAGATVLLVGGVVTASWSTIADASDLNDGGSQTAWICIYVSSCFVYGCWSVNQRLYLDKVHHSDDLDMLYIGGDADLGAGGGSGNGAAAAADVDFVGGQAKKVVPGSGEGTNQVEDDVGQINTKGGRDENRFETVGKLSRWLQKNRERAENGDVPVALHKLVMLTGDTGFQLVVTFTFLPLDAIPWFGMSNSVGATWGNFTRGLECAVSCENSVAYGLLYMLGYVTTYAGEAYLTHYSPTLSTIILQSASPITAIILLIAPSWNANEGVGMWQMQLGGLALLLGAALLYEAWERRNNVFEPPPCEAEEEDAHARDGGVVPAED